MQTKKLDQKEVIKVQKDMQLVQNEIGRIVIGQKNVINSLIRALLCNGHVLLEGIPGIAKTLTIRALANATGCEFKRIQFTVDLLPSDIIGLTTYDEKKGDFYTIKGPIFANFIIADEINRAPPKSQSSLLEAMQEKQATIGKTTFPLPNPFFVMATQNPIESAGTYPLPEAQVDRFLLKVNMSYPSKDEEQKVLLTNIDLKKFEDYKIKPATTPKRILEMQKIVQDIYLSKEIENYILDIVEATRNPKKYDISLGKYIEWGGSPRTSIGLFVNSKADALLNGKTFVTPQNVKNVAYEVMRHRIILNYEGEAENIKTDQIISEILKKVPIP